MKIMINLENTDDYRECEIDPNLTVLDLKANISTLFNIEWSKIDLIINNQILSNNSLIKNLNINDSVVILRKKVGSSNYNYNNSGGQLGNMFNQFMNANRNNMNNNVNNNNNNFSALMRSLRSAGKEQVIQRRIKIMKDRYLTSPEDLDYLFKHKPDIAEAIVAGDDKKLEEIVRKDVDKEMKEESDKEAEYIRLMNSDPNDPNVQRKIEKIIQEKNIDENYRQAQELIPETLFPVHMLFINLEINNKKVVALVDTGAQVTIMSQNLCKKCDLFNLCDTRCSGIATGVGFSRIVGVIHAAQIKVSGKVILGKISVLEGNKTQFIFGLDNMRTHRCVIDLSKSGLYFPDMGVTAKFLSDGEIRQIQSESNDNDDGDIPSQLVNSDIIKMSEEQQIEQAKFNSLQKK